MFYDILFFWGNNLNSLFFKTPKLHISVLGEFKAY